MRHHVNWTATAEPHQNERHDALRHPQRKQAARLDLARCREPSRSTLPARESWACWHSGPVGNRRPGNLRWPGNAAHRVCAENAQALPSHISARPSSDTDDTEGDVTVVCRSPRCQPDAKLISALPQFVGAISAATAGTLGNQSARPTCLQTCPAGRCRRVEHRVSSKSTACESCTTTIPTLEVRYRMRQRHVRSCTGTRPGC